MDNKCYIDGVQHVHYLGGMVRLDLFRLAPQANSEPLQESAGQLIMTPQGLVSMLNAMQQLAEKLTEAGVLQKRQNT